MRTEHTHTASGGKSGLPGTRRALAAAYFPDTDPDEAVRRLRLWIRRCKPLYSRLTQGGSSFDRRKLFTVREVRLIMEYLGEPGEGP